MMPSIPFSSYAALGFLDKKTSPAKQNTSFFSLMSTFLKSFAALYFSSTVIFFAKLSEMISVSSKLLFSILSKWSKAFSSWTPSSITMLSLRYMSIFLVVSIIFTLFTLLPYKTYITVTKQMITKTETAIIIFLYIFDIYIL